MLGSFYLAVRIETHDDSRDVSLFYFDPLYVLLIRTLPFSACRCGNVASILELDEHLAQEYKVFHHAAVVRDFLGHFIHFCRYYLSATHGLLLLFNFKGRKINTSQTPTCRLLSIIYHDRYMIIIVPHFISASVWCQMSSPWCICLWQSYVFHYLPIAKGGNWYPMAAEAVNRESNRVFGGHAYVIIKPLDPCSWIGGTTCVSICASRHKLHWAVILRISST